LQGDAEGLEQNREILSAGRRAASLTQQLLALSRKQLLRPSRLDLNAITRDIETMLRRTIGEDIALSIDCAPGLGAIEADRGQIEQALINLAVNARDAMRSAGKLFIKTSRLECGSEAAAPRAFIRAGSYSVISVRDTGIGMDQATQERIFEPFFTTKEPGKGTGLGLSTVYGIMKQSRGYITVDSRPGNGAEFRLYFPVVAGVAESVAPQERCARAPHGHESVLLIEDEDALRSVVGNVLRSHGYTVLDAAAGEAAIAIADNFPGPIDLLLTDVILPQTSGPGVARHLRESRPSIKVMYMSGYTDEFIAHHGDLDRPMVLLEKPFSITSLLQKIRETLDEGTAHADSAAG
jgi:CheY-like chemotaxis protein